MKAQARRRIMERKIVELLLLGSGVNQICRDLHISKRRLRDVRVKAVEAGYLDGRNPLPAYPEALFPDQEDGRTSKGSSKWSELLPHKAWIKDRLEAGWHKITIFEELQLDESYRSSFYRFLIKHRLEGKAEVKRRVIPEIIHTPGEALLVDWGHLWTIVQNGKKVKVWMFVGVLGYSRHMVVRLMTACDQERTLHALADMYQAIGGVPKRTTSDNPRIFATKASKYETEVHPIYERFAYHYGTVIECLPPRDPQKKGKVERPMPYLRRLMEGYAGDKADLVSASEYLDKKIALANQRRHGTTNERPVDRFLQEEQPALKPLPPLVYEQEHYHQGRVRLDGHVRFLGKYYSVEESYIHKDVTVIGNSKQVAIFHEGKLIETHERVTDRLRSKSTKSNHRKPWEQVCVNDDWLRGEARKIGGAAEAVVNSILLRGDGFIDFRRIWGIMSLTKKYSDKEVNDACQEALVNDTLTMKAIESLIVSYREESAIEALQEIQAPPGRYQRPLSEYSALLLNLNQKGNSYEH
jgi:hypothetical protein